MAISDSQKVDLLWKKVGFGKMKTDTNASKFAPNEANASDFIIKSTQIWAQDSSITGVIPAANSSVTQVYLDSVSGGHEFVEDGTATDNRTWKTGITNWIPPTFGATYQLKVYAAPTGTANPQTNGTQLFETGSGNDDQWYFDYQSGILNFIGSNLPTAIGTGTSNVLYAAGAKYVGTFGVTTDVGSTANTFVGVATLSSLFSRTDVNAGDIIEISDGGDGEYAIYMAKQDDPASTGHLTLISSKDSAGADSQTLRANVTFNGGNVSLGDLSASSMPTQVIVDVTTAFNGSTTISVGDDNDVDRLIGGNYIDVSEVGKFVVNPNFVYTDATDANNTVKVYVGQGSSSQGAATVTVTYS
jgi:hypothetical protein|tara:strand:- start:8469 stop:9542 length:1074 start_codon:yes stop_codon:yes gene_type:complete